MPSLAPSTSQPDALDPVEILGVTFFQGTLAEAGRRALAGGLVVAPSAPGMAQDMKNPIYAAAVRSADLAIPDSGYMVLLWRLFKRQSIQRISGLALMRELVEKHAETLAGETLWAMPNEGDADALRAYFEERGLELDPSRIYLAPFYDALDPQDPVLLERIRVEKPRAVVLAIAGGKQEPLGGWLRARLDKPPAIICTGAAIGFLTGQQVNIPPWADRFFLGWFFRLAREPKRYWRRYWSSICLITKIW